MKIYIPALLTAVVITLTACGGGEGAADTSPAKTSVSAKTASPTARPVPNVVGKTYRDARTVLNNSDYFPHLLGKDGKEWTTNIVPNDSVIVVSVSPAADKRNFIDVTVNLTEEEFLAAVEAKGEAGRVAAEAARIAAEEAKIATRYTFSCNGITSTTTPDHKAYKDVWVSTSYKSSVPCSVKIGGASADDKTTLIPSEQKLVDFVASR